MLTLLGVFAATALVLACIGLYGVMAYAVTQRTREMGIRIALGAGAGQVIALVMRAGMKLVLIGLGIGAACSVGAGYLIANQLYNVSRADPAVLGLVALALLTATMAACWLPARKATRVNPVEALRAE
jgi:ABC-type antimicrobial peptide transport system permease subunit